jgi:hypothetical protein
MEKQNPRGATLFPAQGGIEAQIIFDLKARKAVNLSDVDEL